MKKCSFIFYVTFICFELHSQDVIFNMPNSAAIYANAANAGSVSNPRLQFAYFNQYPNLSTTMATHYAGADFYVKNIKSGFGVFYLNDNQARDMLKNNQIGFIYNYAVSLKKDLVLVPALQYVYSSYVLNPTKFNYNNVINLRTNEFCGNATPLPSYTKQVNNFGSGLLLKATYFNVGCMVNNINKANVGLASDVYLKTRVTAHGDATFYNAKKTYTTNLFFRYDGQDNFNGLQLGLNNQLYKHLQLGFAAATDGYGFASIGYGTKCVNLSLA